MTSRSLADTRAFERVRDQSLVFHVAPDGCLWAVSESTYGHVGGVFCSLGAAVAFARAEARAARFGASVVVHGEASQR
jgi:hypothetical protein